MKSYPIFFESMSEASQKEGKKAVPEADHAGQYNKGPPQTATRPSSMGV